MIRSFKDQAVKDIFNGINSKAARSTCPQTLWRIAFRKLDQLDSAETLDDLRVPPGNCLEMFKGDRQSQHSIRINEQYPAPTLFLGFTVDFCSAPVKGHRV